jgi:Na+-translocating ferredoxin:NAD+ oxidoreductase subunit B
MLTAIINEELCIGCSRCIPACPVDALVGSKGQMHSVLVNECIGCKLCINPCPVDCIDMVPLENKVSISIDKKTRALKAKQRYKTRQQRLLKITTPRLPTYVSAEQRKQKIQAYIQQAVLKKSLTR